MALITQLTELVVRKDPGLLPEFLPEMTGLQVRVCGWRARWVGSIGAAEGSMR